MSSLDMDTSYPIRFVSPTWTTQPEKKKKNKVRKPTSEIQQSERWETSSPVHSIEATFEPDFTIGKRKRHVRGKFIEIRRQIRRNERRKSVKTIQHLLFMLEGAEGQKQVGLLLEKRACRCGKEASAQQTMNLWGPCLVRRPVLHPNRCQQSQVEGRAQIAFTRG